MNQLTEALELANEAHSLQLDYPEAFNAYIESDDGIRSILELCVVLSKLIEGTRKGTHEPQRLFQAGRACTCGSLHPQDTEGRTDDN